MPDKKVLLLLQFFLDAGDEDGVHGFLMIDGYIIDGIGKIEIFPKDLIIYRSS